MKALFIALTISGLLVCLTSCKRPSNDTANADKDSSTATQVVENRAENPETTTANRDADSSGEQNAQNGGSDSGTQVGDGKPATGLPSMPLGMAMVGETRVKCAQQGGPLVAGQQRTLFVKVGYLEDGTTTVRAWIGAEDPTGSSVGTGEFSRAKNGWEIPVTVPDPLPPGAMWWIELERPDGVHGLGSIAPL